MLWALMSIVVASWVSRAVAVGHADWQHYAAAFGAGAAAGATTALALAALAAAPAGGIEAEDGFARVMAHFWWVAALGSGAGLVAAWRAGARKTPST